MSSAEASQERINGALKEEHQEIYDWIARSYEDGIRDALFQIIMENERKGMTTITADDINEAFLRANPQDHQELLDMGTQEMEVVQAVG